MTKKLATSNEMIKTAKKTGGFTVKTNKKSNLIASRSEIEVHIEPRSEIELLLEAGLQAETDYITGFQGVNVFRSEARLFSLYDAMAEILQLIGKIDIVVQGSGNRDELTVKYEGNTYNNGITSTLRVGVDALYRNESDIAGILRALELRCGTKNLNKNIHNNARAITGEATHFNHIISSASNIKGDYFTSITFVDMGTKDYTKVVSSMLAVHELGFQAAVVPYRAINGKKVVFLKEVPEAIQLLNVLKGN